MHKERQIILDNKYILLSRVGDGGFSKVYLAKKINDENENKKYAIKILKSDKSSVADKRCFSYEVDIFKELSKEKNKYVPSLYDYGEGFISKDGKEINTKRLYLVIDYAEKKDLSLYLDKTSDGFEEDYARLIFKKILEGIQFCHNAKICHLDIKMDNILLDENFDPIITDFGLSIKIEGKEAILQHARGSKCYIPPEMYVKGAKKISFKADIFSLGALLFRLVTKKWGFKTSKVKNENYRHIANKNMDIYWNDMSIEINKTLSDEFKDLYFKMVKYNPANRLTIEEIFKHPWMKKIIDLKQDEYNKLEMEVFKYLAKLEEKIKEDNEVIEKKNDSTSIDSIINSRSGDGKEKYNNFVIKKLNMSELHVDNYIIIKGNIEPNEFMCELYEEINKDKSFNAEKYMEPPLEDLKDKIIISFEKNKEEEKDEQDEDEDEESEIKEKDCVIKIKLYQNENNEYIIAFIKKEGENEDYYDYFMKLKEIIKKI